MTSVCVVKAAEHDRDPRLWIGEPARAESGCLWICEDCAGEALMLMFCAATGGDLEPRSYDGGLAG